MGVGDGPWPLVDVVAEATALHGVSGKRQKREENCYMSKKKKLGIMNEIKRRNKDREDEFAYKMGVEAHMIKRLSEIRAKEVPPELEPVRQEIIERYEHDLATWAR